MTLGPSLPDRRVPGFLGRVLDRDGRPVGTCFQVAPGVLVTAWHVLQDIGAAQADVAVRLDLLAGSDPFGATVARLDPVHDLAVLQSEVSLPACTGPLTATDDLAKRTPVMVTGHAVLEDDASTYRFLDGIGEWAGGTTRDDAVALGRMIADRVVPGMSGAPVIRESDGAVAGLVSGRFNSADGWPPSTVWVARTEDLIPLLDGIAEINIEQPVLTGPLDLLLEVTAEQVRLTGPGIDVAAKHEGVRPGLAAAVNEARRVRTGTGQVLRAQPQLRGARKEELSLERAGRLLGEAFLPAPVASVLAQALRAADRVYQPVQLGVAPVPDFAGLPWEALPSPDGRGPLALHPLVSVYRKADAGRARPQPGPLRIVVAIAAPDDSASGLVDYERHLRSVIAAVRSARQDDAEVRVVPFATMAAIRDELNRAPAHILHMYGHGKPGMLELEHDDGTAQLITASEFLAEAIPPGKMPPVVVLSACYTDAASSIDGGASFAAALCARGAAAVIGTETSVTDVYATRLLARLYSRLARTREADVIAALADARREVQRELDTSADPQDQELAAAAEWAVVTVLAAASAVPLLDPGSTWRSARAPEPPRIKELAARGPWYFVGRRAEQRSWPADLLGPGRAGIVIYGIGGTGKTTLAAELTVTITNRDPGRVVVSQAGPLTLDGLLGVLISAARRYLLLHEQDDSTAIRALDVAARADLSWADRLTVLRDHVLDHIPVLVVLDNFEDNLCPDGAGYRVRDQVLAGLLTAWAADPGASRLLVTSRYAFALPGGAERALAFRQLGPLSRAETMKLAWSLPALDTLTEADLDRVWRLAGGHPRSLEYIDALLSDGTARYPDVTTRLNAAISGRLGGEDRRRWLAARTNLDAALAETISIAADEVLLDELVTRLKRVPGAKELLLGISVYREPVDVNAVLFQAGQPAPATDSAPDRETTFQQVNKILSDAGIRTDRPFDLGNLPQEVRDRLAPHLDAMARLQSPPYLPPPDLGQQISACQMAGLLTIRHLPHGSQLFVHRWTATELAAQVVDSQLLIEGHRQAAAYWRWRFRVWPQDQRADVHDLLEARHHLLAAGELEEAVEVSEIACERLHGWGAWDQEASLIHDDIARLPKYHPHRAKGTLQLGRLAHDRGDYDQAKYHYQDALQTFEQLGDQSGMATAHHNQGVLAYDHGNHAEAERHYQAALAIKERLGDQDNPADTYHQLGMLAHDRGDYAVAERRYEAALAADERLGNQAGMAKTFQQLGFLAQERGDYVEAERQYQSAVSIQELLGNQAGMASIYHNLGTLAQARGDYAEAEHQFHATFGILEMLGAQADLGRLHHDLGTLAQVRGDYAEAERQYHGALAINERLGDQGDIAKTTFQLGTLCRVREDYEQAERCLEAARTTFERLGSQVNTARTTFELGILCLDREDYEQAERHLETARTTFERLGNQVDTAMTCTALGILMAKGRNNPALAIAWHSKALELRLSLGIPNAIFDLRPLASYRVDFGAERFSDLLAQATSDAELIQAITAGIDQLEAAETAGDSEDA